ncbi:hypothetical protein SUDANB121_00164 [Nocardiopsis dassonvillei]|uniref:TetR/AcrR family transcriptional regulator n=1 Tax=Nocardiopsis dassonvillei TaxID=2014 RepID=UPI003F566E03
MATAAKGRPPMTEQRKQVIRFQIARAAMELFTEKGVAGTTGDDIAGALGISTRTLWRYFPNKEGCVRPLLTSGLEMMAARLRDWPADLSLVDHLDRAGAFAEGGEAVEEPVAALIRMTPAEPGLMAVWLDVHRAAEDVFARILAQRRGAEPGDFSVRVQAAALNAALRSAAEQQALRGGSAGMGALMRVALVALADGFGPARA